MPPDLSRRFRVRGYECDPYGHLNNTMYLRYRQATDEGSTLRGSLVREQIEYLRQLGPGDEVLVEGTVEVALDGYERRSYRFTTEAGDAATLVAEWAEGAGAKRGVPLPDAPPPPPGTFTIDLPIEWRDVGVDGYAAPATLAALAEHAGVRVVAEHGWPMQRCTEAGFAMVLRRLGIEYSGHTRLEDEIRVDTWASDLRRSTAVRHYVLTDARSGTAVAQLRSLYVWVGTESGRPVRIRDDFLADFAANFA